MATPEDLIGGLASVPVTLLPVRLEARFVASPQGRSRELRVRIYPDQVHIDSHQSALTEAEVEAGRGYWRARWAGQAEAAWADLSRGLRPPRARWVVDATAPTNLDRLGDPSGPVFADPPVRTGDFEPARAAALPERWVVLGYRAGTEAVRKWSEPVRRDLPLGPSLDAAADEPLGADGAWIADYDRAVAAGMAVTITPLDMVSGHRVDNGFDRIVVLGVDWTVQPDVAARRLEDLLVAHAHSDGLAFLAPGTPTNNTPEQTAGGVAGVPVRDPSVAGGSAGGERVRTALGLTPGSVVERVAGAEMALGRVEGLLVSAVWEATLGYFLDQLLDPAVDDRAVSGVRAHARRHLHPAGPFAPLRIGRQPFGVLPVVAPTHIPPDVASLPAGLLAGLGRIRPAWTMAARSVPRLTGESEGVPSDAEGTLFQVLQLTPWATRYQHRRVFGPLIAANTTGLTAAADLQGRLRRLTLDHIVQAPVDVRLSGFVVHPDRHRLRVPLVQRGAPAPDGTLSPNYLRRIRDDLRKPNGRLLLNQVDDPGSVLEGLVTLAALHELDGAAARLQSVVATTPVPVRPMVRAWRTPEMPGISRDAEPSPRLRAEQPIATAGNRPLREVVATELLRSSPTSPAHRLALVGLRELLGAVDALTDTPVAELEQALRGVLDACAYRLDAWYTSVAERLLADRRAAQPTGVHVGGFGWVENLRPENRPDSLGYLAAPSLAHAEAAAILRSGYLAHRSEGVEAFDINLTSERARLALDVLRGVAAGQPLGLVLGYRFERGLREAGHARLLPRLRAVAPFRPPPDATPSTPPPSGPAELTAARDTVDGAVLLARRAAAEAAVSGELPAARAAVASELSRLADVYDAVGDLSLAESVYQLVRGQPARARAALSLLDRQDPAPEPDIASTPRSGTGFVHRVAVVLPTVSPPPAWAPLSKDARATAEPRLNAWFARLLGPPGRWRFAGQSVSAAGAVLASADIRLADLGLSPLSLVLATAHGTAGEPSELEERVAQLLAARLGPQPEGATLRLLPGPPPGGGGPAAEGLGTFLALAGAARRMLQQSAPADAAAFVLPDTPVAPAVDVAELASRATAVEAAFTAAHTALDAALARPSPTAGNVLQALDRAARAGARGAVPPLALAALAGAPTDPAPPPLLDLAGSVSRSMAATVADLTATPLPAPASPAAEAAQHVRRLKLIAGEDCPILPRFGLGAADAAEFARSVADATALTGGDRFAPVTWFAQLARVRAGVDALWHLLTGAEAVTGGFEAGHVRVAQLPHRAGTRWAALPFDAADSDKVPQTHVAVVAVAPDGIEGGNLAGLVVDSWTEFIPSPVETAGLSFHYDAPGNRAPQCVLLAVPPDPAAATWTFAQLADTVLEAIELTHLRAVTLPDVPLASAFLPAIYVPFNPSREVPAFDVFKLAAKATGAMVLGKD